MEGDIVMKFYKSYDFEYDDTFMFWGFIWLAK